MAEKTPVRRGAPTISIRSLQSFPIGEERAVYPLLKKTHGLDAVYIDSVKRTGEFDLEGTLYLRPSTCGEVAYVGPSDIIMEERTWVQSRIDIGPEQTDQHFLPTSGLRINPFATVRQLAVIHQTAMYLGIVPPGARLHVAELESLQLERPVPQGCNMQTEVSVLKHKNNAIIADATVSVNNKLATIAEGLTFVIDEDPKTPFYPAYKLFEAAGHVPAPWAEEGDLFDPPVPFYDEAKGLYMYRSLLAGETLTLKTHMELLRSKHGYIEQVEICSGDERVGELEFLRSQFLTLAQANMHMEAALARVLQH